MTVSASRAGRVSCAALIPGALIAALTPAAWANPVVNFNVDVSGSPVQNFNGIGANTVNPQLFSHQGGTAGAGWTLGWDFISDPDAVGGGRLGCVFTFENTLADVANPALNHLQADITITLPVNAVGLPATFMGNAAMTFLIRPNAFNNDGVLDTVGNNAMWTYGINGVTAGSLFQPGSGVPLIGAAPVDGDSTMPANQNLAQFQYLQPVNNISVRLRFDITPGEKVTFNGAFLFIPAPGALGVFALAGIVGGRRRRS